MKPKVFIGSSKESLQLAYAVQENLEYEAEVTVWTQGIFGISTYTLDTLIDVLNKVDFGIFILGPDDVMKVRGQEYRSPRDNIVLELGLFIGRLGRQRSFFIQPRGIEDLHLPTDLAGLTPATFETNRQDQNLNAALGPACRKISTSMKEIGVFHSETETRLHGKFDKVLQLGAAEVADITGVRVQDIGIHLWLIGNVSDFAEPVLVRKARARLSNATPSPHSGWEKGKGVVGQCWKRQTDVSLDLTDPQLQNCSEDKWNERPSDLRMGLTYNEFRETTRHFKAIFASPIVSREDFVGCVSLNIDRESEVPFDAMWTDNVKRVLRRTAGFLELLLQ